MHTASYIYIYIKSHQPDIFRWGVEAGAVERADSAPLKEDKRARPVFSQEKRVKDLNFKKTIM